MKRGTNKIPTLRTPYNLHTNISIHWIFIHQALDFGIIFLHDVFWFLVQSLYFHLPFIITDRQRITSCCCRSIAVLEAFVRLFAVVVIEKRAPSIWLPRNSGGRPIQTFRCRKFLDLLCLRWSVKRNWNNMQCERWPLRIVDTRACFQHFRLMRLGPTEWGSGGSTGNGACMKRKALMRDVCGCPRADECQR